MDAPLPPGPRKRRKRYSGTHPRRFEEKYKELDAERYPEEIEKAKARGSTPAGQHVPIMAPEIARALEPLDGARVLDCTLGWGGHAQALIPRLGPAGRYIGLDRDGAELARAEERLKKLGLALTARRANYAGAAKILRELELGAVDAVLADLGVSSMQLDRPERGMSFKVDGPLDMRMDQSRGKTAAEWLAAAAEEEIAAVLTRFGEEPDAPAIARVLTESKAEGRSPRTTAELCAAVSRAKDLGPRRMKKKTAFSAHPAARTFQALRIAVNGELEALGQLLRDLPYLIKEGGRAAILTFHSLEERQVREALAAQAGLWKSPVAEPRRPSAEEVRANPRARSARLWTLARA